MPEVTFSHAVLLLPVASLLHVLEEWPRFPRWARRFASARYTDREYLLLHAAGLLSVLVAALLASRFPKPWLLFLLFALVVGPGMLWNGVFHLGATLASRTYCAGAVTGLLVYVPLSAVLARLAVREALLGPAALLVALALALAVHVLEVGHNVFKRW
jgi:hypothetical protein